MASVIKLIAKIILNAIGIYIASGIIPNFYFHGTLLQLFLVSLIFTLVNWLFGGILKFLFRPLIFLSLGVLALLINMATLWLTDYFAEALNINSFLALFLATLLLTAINMIPIKSKSKPQYQKPQLSNL